MFKKFIFGTLLSCLLVTSSYAEVTMGDVNSKDLSSNEVAKLLTEDLSKLFADKRVIGKKVTFDILKPGHENHRITIKNGTCRDTSVVANTVRVQLQRGIEEIPDNEHYAELRNDVIILRERALMALLKTSKALKCKSLF